jgi:putative copper resistance protein D
MRAVHAGRVVAVVVIAAAWAAAAPMAAAHGSVPAEAPTALSLIFGWWFEPLVLLPLAAVAIGWWRLLAAVDRAHPGHRVALLRRWSFLAGLAAIAIALQSGIERYDTTLFSIHMVQHLLLTLVAPPLLALGAPVTQVLRAASPPTRTRRLLPILHSRVIRVVGHPVVAWIALAGVMWATHFSPIFDASLENPPLHDLEHGLYLGAGLLFWWPVVGLDPAPHRMRHPARILYLFLQMPQNSFLAMAILFAGTPLYPHYATLGSPYGIDALADQRLAAGIMWLAGDVIFLAALLAVLGGWMRSEERGSAAAERRADVERGVIREREAAHRRRRAAGDPGQTGTGEASSSR